MRSKYEERVELDLIQRDIKSEYEPIRVPYLSYYVPDFIIYRDDGTFFYLETKGWFKNEDRLKMWRVKEHNPDLDIRILFQRNGKLSKNRTYKDWCDKYNFPCAFGEKIPEEWMKRGKGIQINKKVSTRKAK